MKTFEEVLHEMAKSPLYRLLICFSKHQGKTLFISYIQFSIS